MIVREELKINGKDFIKTYSDEGFYIEREGVRYSEAIDPAETNRVYFQTKEPIEGGEEE